MRYVPPEPIQMELELPQRRLDLPHPLAILVTTFAVSKGVEDFEKRMNWPARSGKVGLEVASKWLETIQKEMDNRVT